MHRPLSALLSLLCVPALFVPALTARAQPTPPPAAGAPQEPVVPPVSGPSATPPASTTPQPPTVPQQTSTTETTPPAAPPAVVPPPPPSTLERAASAVADAVRIYGILKPTVTYSSHAVESFGNPNASAVTAAANPALANLPNESRLTFQVAQTRFGLWLGEKTKYRGHLEFDMIDFTKASPTVQALIRLRIAAVEWSPTEQLVIAAGQDWDLDAPINPFGVNLVGGQFQSGNHAFMRQQVKALYTFGKSLELGGAIGLQGANATNKDAAVELSRMPTFALRLTGLLGKRGRVGVSGLVTRLRFTPGPMERDALSAVGTVFGDLTLDTFSVRFEGYVGRNVGNTGSLALATGSRANDVEEAGFFVSARQTFLDNHAVYATYSYAGAFDGDKVVPSYAYATAAAGTTPALGTGTLSGTGAGLRRNMGARLGYDYKPIKALAIALEGFWYRSWHQLLPVDQARLDEKRHAFGGDLAMVYTF